ncbi:hypothetical protein [Devosia sp. Naph2]|uniref:hypothetical protein n=1 Tax=Devosia polycyclovorans TaxID=3345148 RepID=UPI0035D052CD
MSNTPPIEVARLIKDKVYEAADQAHYLTNSRTQNSQFIASLVDEAEVGGVLKGFMAPGEVRTYIKDAVLNRYSKDKAAEAVPDDFEALLARKFGKTYVEMERLDGGWLRLHRCLDKPGYVVTSVGTYLKWETALRKALLYIPGKPFSQGPNSVEVLLLLYAQGRRVTDPDRRLLEDALSWCCASAHIL